MSSSGRWAAPQRAPTKGARVQGLLGEFHAGGNESQPWKKNLAPLHVGALNPVRAQPLARQAEGTRMTCNAWPALALPNTSRK